MYFQYYTCMRVHNILRELSKDDNVAKDDYYFLAKDKKVRKSQSSRKLLPSKKKSEINDENHHHHHHHHHQHFQPKKKYENIYELPYISNKTEKEFRKREHKIKDYYENKLLKYKDHIKKLKNDNQIQYIQAQYVDQNHPLYKSFFPPPPQRKIYPHRHLNNYNNYNYESKRDNYLPRIPPPLPPPQREYKEMPNTMERVMARFYNQMSKDRNNFFVKFNKNNYFDKKNDDSQYDDYSSSDSSGLEPEEKYSKNKLIDIPYVNPNYPNVQYHNYINKNEIKNNNMIPGMVKVEEYTETVESEESETTSIRHINGMNGRSIEKRSLSTMNIGNGIYDNYYQNQNKEIKSNKEETEEEESEEEEEEEEDENED